jgi:hypothetical protein
MKLLMSLQSNGLLSGEADRQQKAKDAKAYPDIAALANFAKTKENFHDILVSPRDSSTPSASGSPELLPLKDESLQFDLVDCTTASTSAQSSPSGGELLPFPTSNARMDPERADLLWNLASHGSPKLKPLGGSEAEAATSGVYMLSSPCMKSSADPEVQSIFKPLDEEAFARRGIELGMGAVREEAAFVIDRSSGGRARVPVTARASLEEGGVRRKGSVQLFVEGSLGPVEDFGVPRDLSSAEAMISLDDAQAVACLDIRICNTDRHPGNLLVAGEKPYKLICIDHGCVLPAWWALDSACFDAWLDWPHMRSAPSEATMNLVRQASEGLPRIVVELEKLGLPLQAIWTLKICTLLLEHGVLTHQIPLRSLALLMTRSDPAEPCWLERKIQEACAAADLDAKFVPEGKYRDLTFHIDEQFEKAFSEAGSTSNQRLDAIHNAFFIFLGSAFANPEVICAAKAADEAM